MSFWCRCGKRTHQPFSFFSHQLLQESTDLATYYYGISTVQQRAVETCSPMTAIPRGFVYPLRRWPCPDSALCSRRSYARPDQPSCSIHHRCSNTLPRDDERSRDCASFLKRGRQGFLTGTRHFLILGCSFCHFG